MVTEQDVAALQALLTRYTRVYRAKKADEAVRDQALARIAAHQAQMLNFKAAFSLFGFDIYEKEVFKKVRAAIGDANYDGAIAAVIHTEKPATVAVATNSVPGGSASIAEAQGETKDPPPKVREAVLANLKAADKQGTKAKDIREFYENTYAVKLHEKTIGMTLYRLSSDGLARREGRVWFYVPPEGETKNPGGETPGLIEMLK